MLWPGRSCSCVARHQKTVGEWDLSGCRSRMIDIPVDTLVVNRSVVDAGFEESTIVRAVSSARGLVLCSECLSRQVVGKSINSIFEKPQILLGHCILGYFE